MKLLGTKGLGVLLAFMLILPLAGLAKEIKPGVTISQENYQEYLPELKRLLDPATCMDVVRGLKEGVYSLPIVEREDLPQHQLFYDMTMKYAGTCKVGSDNALIGWKGGMPFPNPKTGAELCWNLDRREMVANQTAYDCDFLLSKNWELERSFQMRYWNLYFTGRFIPPIPEVPGNKGVIRMKESLMVTKPFDIKGFCYIRTRYDDIYKPDDVYSYIPAIRRMRRLTGADVCDPILGTDMIYDDFEFMRQKITPQMTFKFKEQDVLVPSHIPYRPWPPDKWPPDKWPALKMLYLVEVPWEIRPCYVLEININDPDYLYSKRIIYLEKQRLTGLGYYLNTFDQRGRMHRSEIYWDTFQKAPTYFPNYFGISCANHFAEHRTFMDTRFTIPEPSNSPKLFSFRWLLKQVR